MKSIHHMLPILLLVSCPLAASHRGSSSWLGSWFGSQDPNKTAFNACIGQIDDQREKMLEGQRHVSQTVATHARKKALSASFAQDQNVHGEDTYGNLYETKEPSNSAAKTPASADEYYTNLHISPELLGKTGITSATVALLVKNRAKEEPSITERDTLLYGDLHARAPFSRTPGLNFMAARDAKALELRKRNANETTSHIATLNHRLDADRQALFTHIKHDATFHPFIRNVVALTNAINLDKTHDGKALSSQACARLFFGNSDDTAMPKDLVGPLAEQAVAVYNSWYADLPAHDAPDAYELDKITTELKRAEATLAKATTDTLKAELRLHIDALQKQQEEKFAALKETTFNQATRLMGFDNNVKNMLFNMCQATHERDRLEAFVADEQNAESQTSLAAEKTRVAALCMQLTADDKKERDTRWTGVPVRDALVQALSTDKKRTDMKVKSSSQSNPDYYFIRDELTPAVTKAFASYSQEDALKKAQELLNTLEPSMKPHFEATNDKVEAASSRSSSNEWRQQKHNKRRARARGKKAHRGKKK